MHLRIWLITALALPSMTGGPMAANACAAQDDALKKLGGTWHFVEDRTEGRPVDKQGPPMSVRFELRVEKDGVIYPRRQGDERITLDGSVIERKNDNGSITRFNGKWKNGSLVYTLKTERLSDNKTVLTIRREFRATDEGLLINVTVNDGTKQVALYRHPEDVALPKPAKAVIADMTWLAGAWGGMRRTSSIEERWTPPRGGAMLGISRTVRRDKMVAFEFLRVVERDGGLVYIAQPGGRPPTEFTLTELKANRAVFVNPRHTYPQRIIYELSKDGALKASIGFAKGRLQSFDFKRESK